MNLPPSLMSPEEYARYYPPDNYVAPAWRGQEQGVPSVPDMTSPIFSPPTSTEGLVRDPVGGSWINPSMLSPAQSFEDQLNAIMLNIQNGAMGEVEGEDLLINMLQTEGGRRALAEHELGLLDMLNKRVQARSAPYSTPPDYTPPSQIWAPPGMTAPTYPELGVSPSMTKVNWGLPYNPYTTTGARPQPGPGLVPTTPPGVQPQPAAYSMPAPSAFNAPSAIPSYISNPATALVAGAKAGQLNTSIAPPIGDTQSNLFDLVRRMNAPRKGVLGPRQQ